MAPISRLELEAQSAATAKQTAAPRPPSIAVIRMQPIARGKGDESDRPLFASMELEQGLVSLGLTS